MQQTQESQRTGWTSFHHVLRTMHLHKSTESTGGLKEDRCHVDLVKGTK